jgi:RHS repeat-associated protein
MRQFTTPTTSVLYFLHSDHLGSTSLTTDASGNAVARQLYDAWGNIRYVTGTLPTDIGYTGQRLDSTGLMYYRARYYASSLGRFASADTIVPDGKNPQSLNRFSYVRNRPLNSIDPSGHVDCDKNQWGETCESSTVRERDQADSCAEMPSFCTPDTSPGHLAEMGLFFFGGMALSAFSTTANAMYAGYMGVVGNMAGSAGANILQGKPVAEGVFDPLDNIIAYFGGALSFGRSAKVVGLIAGGQSVTKQALTGESIDLGAALASSIAGTASARFASFLSDNVKQLVPGLGQAGKALVDDLIAPTATDTLVKSAYTTASNAVQYLSTTTKKAFFAAVHPTPFLPWTWGTPK